MFWLVPSPGDWHALKNFQEVLLKVYFDGGLRDLAKASGYNPNAIGSNFKRTHNFLMEAWEAMYRHFLTLFHDSNDKKSQEHLRDWLNSFPESLNQQQCHRNLKELISDLHEKFPKREQHFQDFLEKIASKDSTWKF